MSTIGNQNGLKHGHTRVGNHTAEYRAWTSMKTRCTNPNAPQFERYGKRGIKVCSKWMHSFEAFYADVGPRPTPRHSLGRRNNDGNYTPRNVRWETPEEQQSNTSANRLLTAFGRTQTMTQWAREMGIDLSTIWRRLTRLKWPIEKALRLHPVRRKDLGMLVVEAGYRNISEFLRTNSINPSVFYSRVTQQPETVSRLASLLRITPEEFIRIRGA